MIIPTIKQVMREYATFTRYEDNKLWYQISWLDNEDHPHLFDFPVPVDDAGGGSFTSHERALTLMRWLRKHIEFLNEAVKA